MKLKLIAVALLAAVSIAQTATAGPLSISDGKFMKDGKPFYGIGVNYFSSFYRYGVYNDASALAGLATLKQYKIPFIRIPAIAFWPSEIQGSYINNQVVFFQRLDTFMAAAEAQGVGVVLDLFWNWTSFADLKGEHIPEWGNNTSLTRAFMRDITTQVVTKYKDHNALWGWEFANETNAAMDLPTGVANGQGNSAYLPKSPVQGSPIRTSADNYTPATIISALADFATTIRQIDPATPIFSGNELPYYCAYNLQSGSWNSDTPAQFGAIMVRNEPYPVDTFGLHMYAKHAAAGGGKYFAAPGQASTATHSDILAAAMAQSVLSKRPLFLGEFGVGASTAIGTEAEQFDVIVNAVVANRVQMSALWVYDYSNQESTFNVTATNSRKYMLEKVRDINVEMANW